MHNRQVPVSTEALIDDRLYAKITRRLLPLLGTCYVVAYIDRVNISFAQLGMKQTLSLDDQVYAIGAGIFFIGYLLFEIPGTLWLERTGVRRTLLRIMVSWGIVSAAMAFVQTGTQLYVLRFLLGAFEAGFFPGVILYLTYWYPADRRGRIFSTFIAAAMVASIIAGPLSGAILKYCDGLLGFHGWQWLFVLQGAPACLLGIIAFAILPNKPANAGWLTEAEKEYLEQRLADREPEIETARMALVKRLLADPNVHMLALATILFSGANYTLVFWTPSLIKSWGVEDSFLVGLYTVLPSIVSLAGMLLIGRSSDRWGDRRWHFAAATGIATAGLFVAVFASGHLAPSLAGLCFMGFGQAAIVPLFTAIVSNYVPRNIAAAGIAILACVGHIGSAVAPAIVEKISSAWGGQSAGLFAVAGMYLLAGLLIVIALRPALAPGVHLASR